MWDRTKFRMERPPSYNPNRKIFGYEHVWDGEDKGTGREKLLGSLKNIHVYGNQSFISLTGSINTFINGHNGSNFSYYGYVQGINAVGSATGLNLWDAEIMNCEFGMVLSMERPIDEYLIRLKNVFRAVRIEVSKDRIVKTVLFENDLIKLTFYNKGEQMGWPSDVFALKVEVKWKRPARSFGQPLFGRHLADPEIINQATKGLQTHFSKIEFARALPDHLSRLDFEFEPDYKRYAAIQLDSVVTR